MPQTSVICALCARGTTKLPTSRIKFLTAPQSHITTPSGVYITHPKGAYHEFRKEFYITAHSAYITRRKALYHERIAFYITSLCLVRQTTLSTWVGTPKGLKTVAKLGWKFQKVYFIIQKSSLFAIRSYTFGLISKKPKTRFLFRLLIQSIWMSYRVLLSLYLQLYRLCT